ncbi:MAG: 4-hydroxy-3-methylbut-2-enyl diphosphate reductase [Candidatus Dasytiphilus stammeri]
MRILLANPRGFCAGVKRAITIVKRALEIWGIPVYVYHQIVHNSYVVRSLGELGAIFIENLSEVPDKAILIFSAHGVSNKVRQQAKNRNLIILDATCPLVKKVHMKVARASQQGIEAILIGHAGHPEVQGTLGQYNNSAAGMYLVQSPLEVYDLHVKKENNLCFMTQTTLSLEDTNHIINLLQKRFPKITGPRKNDICYATTNRQKAVLNLSMKADMILVIGSRNSSNATRLFEIAHRNCKNVYLIDSAIEIQNQWLKNISSVGITAGASTPDVLVNEVVQYLKNNFFIESTEELNGNKENMRFSLPKELLI